VQLVEPEGIGFPSEPERRRIQNMFELNPVVRVGVKPGPSRGLRCF